MEQFIEHCNNIFCNIYISLNMSRYSSSSAAALPEQGTEGRSVRNNNMAGGNIMYFGEKVPGTR